MYETLRKIYYQSNTQYEHTYQARISSEAAVRIDFQIGGYPAFYLTTKEITFKLAEILSIDKTIMRLCKELPGAALLQYQKKCMIDEIVLTNEIEGVHSTRQEIDSLLERLHKQDRRYRFQGIVKKYAMLIAKESIPMKTSQDIRRLYDELFLDEIEQDEPKNTPNGKFFRKDSVSVYSPTGKELHRGVYPESQIMECVEKALRYLEVPGENILLKTAAFHYMFAYIHPFYDGNGRMSRFISSYLMAGYLEPVTSLCLSYSIKTRVHDYYNAFEECNHPLNRGDITPFIEMFLNIMLENAMQLAGVLDEKGKQLRFFEQKCSEKLCCEPQGTKALCSLLIQAALFSEKGISFFELMNLLHISGSTLRKRLKHVNKYGILVTNKYGRNNFYMLDTDGLIAAQPSVMQ